MTFQNIIDFLLSLVGDEEAQATFEQDPEGTLAAAGLQGVTGQDIRDARLQLSDSGAVSTSAAYAPPGGDDPVQEISYTTQNFSANVDTPDFTTNFIDQSTTITVDDRDITVDDSETTIINDSFNSDDDILAIDNSVDNSIDNSVDNVTAIQDNDVVNNDNDVIDIVDNDVFNQAPEPAVEPAPEPPVEPDPEPEPDLGPVDAPEPEIDEPADPLADAALA